MRSEFTLIEQGFDKLPQLTGNGNKAVIVNAGGTSLTVSNGTITLSCNFAVGGAGGITLTSTGTTNVTLPTTGTLATLAGSETLSNKTLTAPTINNGTQNTPTIIGGTLNNATINNAVVRTALAVDAPITGNALANITINTNMFTVNAVNGNVLVGGVMTYSSAGGFSIFATTSDGADNSSITISGGGGAGITRGATLTLNGNENGSASASLNAGAGGLALEGGSGAGKAVMTLVDGRVSITNGVAVHIGGVSNDNNLGGLTVNQATNNDHIYTGRSTLVTHGLTSGGPFNMSTNDFVAMQKITDGGGGLDLVGIQEQSATPGGLQMTGLGGVAVTTDTTGSKAVVIIRGATHNGANAMNNAAANENVLVVQSWSAGAWTTRMLIKGDDGEVHVGNTTLVALDSEDDVMAVRGLQYVTSGGRGIIKQAFDKRAYSYDKLRRIGVVGKRDRLGRFMIRVQPYLSLHDGAISQLYAMREEDRHVIAALTQQLKRVQHTQRRALRA